MHVVVYVAVKKVEMSVEKKVEVSVEKNLFVERDTLEVAVNEQSMTHRFSCCAYYERTAGVPLERMEPALRSDRKIRSDDARERNDDVLI